MDWLVLCWALTVGYIPLGNTSIVLPGSIVTVEDSSAVVTELSIGVEIASHLRLYGSMETRETLSLDNPAAGLFSPYEAYFKAGLAIYGEGWELGVYHECDHGIEASPVTVPWLWAGRTEIYVKVSGKTHL